MKPAFFLIPIKIMLFGSIFICFKTQAQNGLGLKILLEQLDKSGPENKGSSPDYSQEIFWAATPFKKDASDFVPKGIAVNSQEKQVDVFFIHPTTYITANGNEYDGEDLRKSPLKAVKALKNSPWNADLSDNAVNTRTDSLSLKIQASVFNGSCRIFAPRYRQANLKAFIVSKESENARKAFNLAYSDVKTSFEYYLKNYNNGRPIIIASHSQGSLHAIRLLKEFFEGKTLQNKLVCAYVIGHPIPPNTFSKIPVGENRYQTGCVVSWQTFNANASPEENLINTRGNMIAVNPMTWTTSHDLAPASLNKGILTGSGNIIPGNISCQLDQYNFLQVQYPDTLNNWLKNADNFHKWDYNLFWMNFRENVAMRISSFYK